MTCNINLARQQFQKLNEKWKAILETKPKLRIYKNERREEMGTICTNEYESKGAFLFKSIKIWYLPIEVEVGRYRQKPLTDRLYQFYVNEIEDEKHFIFSCPQCEDLRESIRAIGKAENITEDTVLLHYLMNFKLMCISKFVPSAFKRHGVLTAV